MKALISLIIPCYNEEEQLPETLRVIPAQLPDDFDFELLFVDDGSTDQSWALIQEAAAKDPRVRGLRFSRNFGKEAALVAGLEEARGDAVVILDCDLQLPPRYLPEMLKLWREGAEIVEGVKESRQKESFASRLSAGLFYRLFAQASGMQLKNASDFKLLDRKVVDVWQQLPEKDPFFRGLAAWVGFRRASFSFHVDERQHGQSKWSLKKLFRLSLDALTGFSAKPLQLIALLGLLLELAFVVTGLVSLIRLASGCPLSAFNGVILLQLLIGGLILLALGLHGIYIGRLYESSKDRPRYILSERCGGRSSS